jgi:hypothetical protein
MITVLFSQHSLIRALRSHERHHTTGRVSARPLDSFSENTPTPAIGQRSGLVCSGALSIFPGHRRMPSEAVAVESNSQALKGPPPFPAPCYVAVPVPATGRGRLRG